jgi:hypothetical protein
MEKRFRRKNNLTTTWIKLLYRKIKFYFINRFFIQNYVQIIF